ncbi:MAG: SH3 domain-containing protein [Synechococcales bacterium]|nr:SH3 domain-containing protein [Synechococcales bacterium]
MMVRQIAIAALLSLGTMVMGALPSMARPGTIDAPDFGVNLRLRPSSQAPVIDALPDRTPIEILRIVNNPEPQESGVDWYYVRSTGRLKTEGWIRSGYLRFQPSNQIYGTLAGEPNDVINIRSTPSTQARVLHTGLVGDLVLVGQSKFVPLGNGYGRTGYQWHYITYPNGAAGWVRGDLISVWPRGCIITCPEH